MTSVWSNFSHACRTKLQVIYNRLALTILSADIRTSVIDMLNFLQWDNVSERWKKQNVYHCI